MIFKGPFQSKQFYDSVSMTKSSIVCVEQKGCSGILLVSLTPGISETQPVGIVMTLQIRYHNPHIAKIHIAWPVKVRRSNKSNSEVDDDKADLSMQVVLGRGGDLALAGPALPSEPRSVTAQQ